MAILPIIVVVFIFSMSLMDGVRSGKLSKSIANIVRDISYKVDYDTLHTVIRKIGHLSEFFLLGLTLFVAFRKKGKDRAEKIAFLIATVVACLDEGIQLFVSGRGSSVIDIFIDILGAVIGISVSYLATKSR